MKSKRFVVLVTTLIALLAGTAAQAQPVLQLYIEGAQYDTDSESWVVSSNTMRLWVIGNVELHGPILDVKLATAFKTGETGTIDLTPSQSLLVTDPSKPIALVQTLGVGGDGTLPQLSGGGSLPSHGIYGQGTSFTQWELGNFENLDSPIGDYQYSFPVSATKMGQINVYDVAITGYSMVHFDAYNHVEGFNHAIFSPNSHDATTAVPEPTTLMLVGAGLVGSAMVRRRKKRS